MLLPFDVKAFDALSAAFVALQSQYLPTKAHAHRSDSNAKSNATHVPPTPNTTSRPPGSMLVMNFVTPAFFAARIPAAVAAHVFTIPY